MTFGIVVVILLVFLVTKELAMIKGSDFTVRLSRFLDVAIITMAILFVLLVVLSVSGLSA